jgi:hypothetical protein
VVGGEGWAKLNYRVIVIILIDAREHPFSILVPLRF